MKLETDVKFSHSTTYFPTCSAYVQTTNIGVSNKKLLRPLKVLTFVVQKSWVGDNDGLELMGINLKINLCRLELCIPLIRIRSTCNNAMYYILVNIFCKCFCPLSLIWIYLYDINIIVLPSFLPMQRFKINYAWINTKMSSH